MHRLRNRVNANFYNDDDDAQQVLSLEVEEGRWFDRRDEAMAKSVVVISRDLR